MSLSFLPTYFYLFAWVIFAFLPYVYFSTIGYVVLLSFFSITAICCSIYSIERFRLPIFFKFLFVFVTFLSIYGLYDIILGDPVMWQESGRVIENNRYFLWLITSMLSVVPAYIFTCKGFLREKEMMVFFFIMLVASIYAFDYTNKMLLIEALSSGSKQEEFAITAVYCFLSILPLVLLFKRNMLLQFFLLCIFLFYFVQSAKRGPIILGSICILLMMTRIFISSSKWKKIFLGILSIIFFFSLYRFISFQIENSPYFALRIEQTIEGYSSGREDYARFLLNYFNDHFSVKHYFFGTGAQSTLEINESFAHNDWIAILIEQGVVGILLYLLYWVGYVFTWLKSKHNFEAYTAIAMLLIIGFGKTLFSMYYLPVAADMLASSGMYAIVLGFFLGKAFPQNENLVVEIKG